MRQIKSYEGIFQAMRALTINKILKTRILIQGLGGGRISASGWVFPFLSLNGKQQEAETS